MTFIDTNALIDIATDNPNWAMWSTESLGRARRRGPCLINAIVFAEFAVSFKTLSHCEETIGAMDLTVAQIDNEAAFLAAQAFRRYRRSGGPRLGVLPDFLIGAHAVSTASPLLTRDVRRYRTYFPDLVLIAPDAPSV